MMISHLYVERERGIKSDIFFNFNGLYISHSNINLYTFVIGIEFFIDHDGNPRFTTSISNSASTHIGYFAAQYPVIDRETSSVSKGNVGHDEYR